MTTANEGAGLGEAWPESGDVTEARAVLTTPWFRIETVPWRGGAWYRLAAPDGVLILALTEDRRIAMVRQWRPARERMSLELPAGAMDPGETPEQAARRELLEETGLGGGTWHALGTGGLAIDRETARLHLFLAQGVAPTGHPPEGGVEVRLLTPSAFRAAVTGPEFEQLAALSALTMARWRGLADLL